MKNALYVFILSAFAITAFSQEQKFPSGVYLTLDQLRKKTPAFDVNLQVIRRTEGDIGFNGGNDYEIKSSIDSLNKKGEKVSDSVLVNYIALLNTITPIDSTKTILK